MKRSCVLPQKLNSVKAVRVEAGDREDVPESVRGPAEQHLQHHAEGEGRDRVADENDDAGDEVEGAAVPQRLGDAQRDADQVGQHEPGEAEHQRDGKALPDQLPDGLVGILVGVDRQPDPVCDEPLPVAAQDGLVEAEMLLQRGALGLGDRTDRGGHLARLPTAPHPAHPQHRLLHRPARHELAEGKADQRDAEERGHHQQQPADEIFKSLHNKNPLRSIAATKKMDRLSRMKNLIVWINKKTQARRT